MFDITKNNHDAIDFYVEEKKAYPGAIYDFTFENRFLIYHLCSGKTSTYYAIDMETGLSSQVCRENSGYYNDDNYILMVPSILNAIKYTGDRRYLNPMGIDAEETIETLFRSILPNYGYRIREEQIRLCKEIYKGLTGRRVAICEAEVGTGKSIAYLVAAVCAKKSSLTYATENEPITITTSSIELQNALVTKEIPLLSDILLRYGLIDAPLTVALRKGKEHYFCMLRHEDYLYSISQYPEKYAQEIKLIQGEPFRQGALVDLDKLRLPGRTKGKICARDDCSSCPYHDKCGYSNYISSTMSSSNLLDFQVTNHNLYLISTKIPGILRESQFVIVDEAHKLKDAAQTAFGEVLSELDIEHYLQFVKTKCRNPEDLEQYQQTMSNLRSRNESLFEMVRSFVPTEVQNSKRGEIISLPPASSSLILDMIRDLVSIDTLKEQPKGKTLTSARSLSDVLQAFLKPSEILAWIEFDDGQNLELHCCPKNVGRELARYVWAKGKCHALLSGTMSDGSSFEFFKRENGLDGLPECVISESTSASPFDYANHARLYIPDDIPFPDNTDEEYIKALADRIVDLCHATNGHTAILFTSYRLLQKVYDLAAPRLSQYELFKMTKSNKTVARSFHSSTNGILFGIGSVWEGFDFVGDGLSSLIVVKLPFPIRSAVMEEKKASSADVHKFIQKYAVPEMLIKLRQGAGRLIRSETDTGVISILDARASSNGAYEKKVMKALRQFPLVDSVEEVHEFMKSVKPEEYFNEPEAEEPLAANQ